MQRRLEDDARPVDTQMDEQDRSRDELQTVVVVAELVAALTTNTHTHTHTRAFNGPLSGTTRVSRYQKGKTSLDFTDARDSEWQWHQLGPTDGQTDRQRQTDGSRHRTPNGDRSSIHVPGETGGWSLPGE